MFLTSDSGNIKYFHFVKFYQELTCTHMRYPDSRPSIFQRTILVGQIRAKKQPNRSLCDTSTKVGTNIRYNMLF